MRVVWLVRWCCRLVALCSAVEIEGGSSSCVSTIDVGAVAAAVAALHCCLGSLFVIVKQDRLPNCSH